MELTRQHFETIDSTNTWAKHHATKFDHGQMTLITASEQTAGRGRFSRRWESPANQNIYATFCFFVEKHREDIGNIPQILAISVAEMLKKLGFEAKLKWPNDILLNGKKLSGILCETTTLSENKCIILGIGININMPHEDLQKIDRPATSLHAETGKRFVVEEIIQKLQQEFLPNLTLFLEEGFHPFVEKYLHFLAHTSDSLIRFHDNRIVWEGLYHSINHDGSLNLLLKTGEIKNFNSGEILF